MSTFVVVVVVVVVVVLVVVVVVVVVVADAVGKGGANFHMCPICLKSGKDVKLKNCSLCESHYYCSKECQTAHWPQHKVTCKANRQARQLIQSGLPPDQSNVLKDYKKWEGSRRGLINSLTSSILTVDRYKTHFVHLTVEYRPELRVRFQLSEQYDVPQIGSIPGVRKALEEFGQQYEQGTNKAPMRFFILVLTCSNVPKMSIIMPFAITEDGQHADLEPAEVLNVIRELNSGELKDSRLCHNAEGWHCLVRMPVCV
jgi:hypothetical protein